MNRRNESRLIPADIEDGQLPHLIRRRKNRAQFSEGNKIAVLH